MRAAYVAGRSGDWLTVRRVRDALLAEGYAITYDWTCHAEAGENERNGTMLPEAMRLAAQTDLDAAGAADLLVLVCADDMADALGCYVELGAALSAEREVHVIAPPRPSIFFHLPRVRTFCGIEAWAATFTLGTSTPEHPGTSHSPRRGVPAPPNAAPTTAVPAGPLNRGPAGDQPEDHTP